MLRKHLFCTFTLTRCFRDIEVIVMWTLIELENRNLVTSSCIDSPCQRYWGYCDVKRYTECWKWFHGEKHKKKKTLKFQKYIEHETARYYGMYCTVPQYNESTNWKNLIWVTAAMTSSMASGTSLAILKKVELQPVSEFPPVIWSHIHVHWIMVGNY